MTDKTSWFAESAERHPAEPHRQDWADRFRGAMIGGGVGDALGAGVRYWSCAEIKRCFGSEGVEDYLPVFGRRGAVTDLTQLTVFTLEALLRAKAVNPDPAGWLPTQVVGTNHLRWLFTQGVPWEYAMSAHLQTHPEPSGWLLERRELFVTRNPAGMGLRGMGTLAGAAPAGRNETSGAPLGDASLVDCVVWAAPTMVWSSSPELVFAAGAAISGLLTANGDVHGATGLHSDVLGQLIRGVDLWDAVQESESQRLGRVYGDHTPVNVRRAVQAATFASRGSQPTSEELDVAFDTDGKLGELGIALASVACTDNFADAVHMAVNQSADSSSTGALAGQLAGAIYGTAGIPRRWLDELELRDTIHVLCDDAAEAFAPPRMPKWAQRYVDNKRHLAGALALDPAESSPVSTVDSEAVVEDAAAEMTVILPVAREEPPTQADPVDQSDLGQVGSEARMTSFSPSDPESAASPPAESSTDAWASAGPVEGSLTGAFADPAPEAHAPGVPEGAAPESAGDRDPFRGDSLAAEPVLVDPASKPGAGEPVSEVEPDSEPGPSPVEQASPETDVIDPSVDTGVIDTAAIAAESPTPVPEVGLTGDVDEDSDEFAPEPVFESEQAESTAAAALGWDEDRFETPFMERDYARAADTPRNHGDAAAVSTPESELAEREFSGGTGEFPSVRWVRLPERGEGTYRDRLPKPADVPEAGSLPKRGHAQPRDLAAGEISAEDRHDAAPSRQHATEAGQLTENLAGAGTRPGDGETTSSGQHGAGVSQATEEDESDALHRENDPFPVPQGTRGAGGHAKVEGLEDSAPSLSERVRGCLLGGALGDALGADIEFASSAEISKLFDDSKTVGLREAYGVHGAITDDTQMTLFTAEGLIRGSIATRTAGAEDPIAEIQLAYQRWLHTQGVEWSEAAGEFLASHPVADGWLVQVPALSAVRAPGNTVMNALRGFGRGKAAGSFTEVLNDSKGCGGVMRAAPVALYSADPSEVFTLAARSAALTHGHPTGYHSAGALAVIVQQALLGHGLDDGVWLALQVLETWEDHEETSAMLKLAVDLASRAVPTPRQIEQNLGGGWVGEQALAIAVCAALACDDDVEGALKVAVHHSGDSDSTGAVCGNIVGALHGVDRLPADWLAELELRNVIEQLALDCVAEFGVGEFAHPDDAAIEPGNDWLVRYPVAPGVLFPRADSAEPRGVADGERPDRPTWLLPAVSASGSVAEPGPAGEYGAFGEYRDHDEPGAFGEAVEYGSARAETVESARESGQQRPAGATTTAPEATASEPAGSDSTGPEEAGSDQAGADPGDSDAASADSARSGAETEALAAFPAPKPSPRRINGMMSVEQES